MKKVAIAAIGSLVMATPVGAQQKGAWRAWCKHPEHERITAGYAWISGTFAGDGQCSAVAKAHKDPARGHWTGCSYVNAQTGEFTTRLYKPPSPASSPAKTSAKSGGSDAVHDPYRDLGPASPNTGFDPGNWWRRRGGGVAAKPASTVPTPSTGDQALPGYDRSVHSGQLGQTPLGDFPAPINVATILTPGMLPGSAGLSSSLPGSQPSPSARAEVCLPRRPGMSSAWRGECANAKPPVKPPVATPPGTRLTVVKPKPKPAAPPKKKKTPKPVLTPAPKYASACASLDSLGNMRKPIVVVTQPEIYVTMSMNTLLYLRNLDTGQTYKLGSTDKAIPPGRYILGLYGVANAASPFTETIYACLNYRV